MSIKQISAIASRTFRQESLSLAKMKEAKHQNREVAMKMLRSKLVEIKEREQL
jgi:protein subunit release factor A